MVDLNFVIVGDPDTNFAFEGLHGLYIQLFISNQVYF